jgi:hypothetical protein
LVDSIAIVYNLPITYAEAGPQYEPRAVFSVNAANQLQASIWITKNGEQISDNLGTASYVVYDKDGVALGISQSGLVAEHLVRLYQEQAVTRSVKATIISGTIVYVPSGDPPPCKHCQTTGEWRGMTGWVVPHAVEPEYSWEDGVVICLDCLFEMVLGKL